MSCMIKCDSICSYISFHYPYLWFCIKHLENFICYMSVAPIFLASHENKHTDEEDQSLLLLSIHIIAPTYCNFCLTDDLGQCSVTSGKQGVVQQYSFSYIIWFLKWLNLHHFPMHLIRKVQSLSLSQPKLE